MATTLKKLSEQVQRVYTRGIDTNNIRPNIRFGEVKHLIVQAINETLSVATQQSTNINGIDIPHSLIATYSGRTVTSGVLDLPAYPIRLPRDMGVWEVYNGSTTYIPVSSMHRQLIKSDTSVYGLENQLGYYVEGNKITFTDTANAPVSVDVKLLIADIDTIGDDDALPVPSDMELTIVERVVNLLKQQGIDTELQGNNDNSNNR